MELLFIFKLNDLRSCFELGFSRVLEWFYFTPRDRKYRNGQRPNRSVGDGYWKATRANKEIKFEERNVGYRKVLVFYRESAPHRVKTNWIMHEFRVFEPPKPPRRTGVNDTRVYMKSFIHLSYVLC